MCYCWGVSCSLSLSLSLSLFHWSKILCQYRWWWVRIGCIMCISREWRRWAKSSSPDHTKWWCRFSEGKTSEASKGTPVILSSNSNSYSFASWVRLLFVLVMYELSCISEHALSKLFKIFYVCFLVQCWCPRVVCCLYFFLEMYDYASDIPIPSLEVCLLAC